MWTKMFQPMTLNFVQTSYYFFITNPDLKNMVPLLTHSVLSRRLVNSINILLSYKSKKLLVLYWLLTKTSVLTYKRMFISNWYSSVKILCLCVRRNNHEKRNNTFMGDSDRKQDIILYNLTSPSLLESPTGILKH